MIVRIEERVVRGRGTYGVRRRALSQNSSQSATTDLTQFRCRGVDARDVEGKWEDKGKKFTELGPRQEYTVTRERVRDGRVPGKNSNEKNCEKARIVDGTGDGRRGCNRGGWTLGGGNSRISAGPLSQSRVQPKFCFGAGQQWGRCSWQHLSATNALPHLTGIVRPLTLQ
jgi:hypothetical protein